MQKQFIITVLFFGLLSCNPPSTSHNAKKTTQAQETVQLVFIADRSKSFIKDYNDPAPELFKPLCNLISQTSALDFRYGCIRENSNITFARYYVPHSSKEEATATNPWLNSEKKLSAVSVSDTDWNAFATEVNNRLVISASNGSDIATIISRALVTFGENKNARKILIICSDFSDSYTKQFPAVSQDIEILSVGVLPENPIEEKLHTQNIKRFENLHSSIDYLFSQFKN